MLLDGRIAIVTGAASGIGMATTRLFVEHGARVVAVDRPRQGVGDVFAGMAAVAPLDQDVTDPDAPELITRAALKRFGKLDILFNNAGVGARIPGEATRRAMVDTPPEHWNRVLDINLSAVFRLTRAAAPILRGSPAGRLVFNGSPLATRPDWGIALYTASKAAVQGFARAVAIEEGVHGTTSNWVEPGAIVTGMTSEGYIDPATGEMSENGRLWAAKSPFNRLGEPLDVAKGVLFLASDLASFVTGHGLRIDAGITLKL